MNKFHTLFCILTLGLCLVRSESSQASPSPERSIADSDYAKTANYIMKTAMKLPPHILPTLEELDTKDKRHGIDNQLGVYLPQQRNPLGIYIPRPVPPNEASSQGSAKPFGTRPKRQRPQNKNKQKNRPDQKTRNNSQRERKQQDLPTFTINPVNPDSPIGKLFKLGQNNPPKLKKFSNPRPQQQPQPNLVASASERNPQRQHGPKRGSKIDRNHVPKNLQSPYDYEPTNFEFPPNYVDGETTNQVREEIVPQFNPLQPNPAERNQAKNRRGRPSNQVEKYVPKFMKEVLAKSFLKDPEQYLARLQARERANQMANLRPQFANEDTIPIPLKPVNPPQSQPPPNPAYNDNINSNSRPVQTSQNPSLKFDSNFPWNPNSYDNTGGRFKGGYVYNNKDLSYNLDHKQQYESEREPQEVSEQRRHYPHRGEGSRRQQQQKIRQRQKQQQQQQQQQHEATVDGYIPIEQILNKVSSGEEIEDQQPVVTTDGLPPVTKTICFCCENENQINPESNGQRRKKRSYNQLPRSGRKIKIENPRQSARVFKHQEFLRRSLSCVDQEPIEVVLVFNRKSEPQSKIEIVEEEEVQTEHEDEGNSENHSDEGNEDLTKNPILEISELNWEQSGRRNKQPKKISMNTKPFINEENVFDRDPESREDGGQEQYEDSDEAMTHEYYDPAKLTFIFSTPTPLIKKSSLIDESVKTHLDINNSNNHATIDVDENNNHNNHDDDDNIHSASRRNHQIQSPNHSYESHEEEKIPIEPPIVTKMEDLLKFTSEFQKTIKSRRQKVADSFEESEASKSLVDNEEDYDEEERDEILQASANVPIRKNRLRNHDTLTTTTTSTDTEEKVESRIDNSSKLDSLEVEVKNFPMERRYDVSTAQSGAPKVRFWNRRQKERLQSRAATTTTTEASVSEYEDVEDAIDEESSLGDNEQQQQQQHFEDKPETDIERLEEDEGDVEDEPETEVHLEESVQVTSENIAAPVIEPTTSPNAVTSQLTINNHRLEGEKITPKSSDNNKVSPTVSDMTNGYLFFRMLTG